LESKKIEIMGKKKVVEFKYIKLKEADNGYILDYEEVIEEEGSMESRDWNQKNMVFTEDQLDDAMDNMKAMHIFNKMRKGDTNLASPSFPEAVMKSEY